jgi:hypothetical protein
MYQVFCDETWSDYHLRNADGFYVYYGVLLNRNNANELVMKINEFKKDNGLFDKQKDKFIEIKWERVENEWKNYLKTGNDNRYKLFLDIFFENFRKRSISFGCLYLNLKEYNKYKSKYISNNNNTKHTYFFMLYFQFLFHCFLKNQIKQEPCEIFIDERDLGAKGSKYDIDELREILNKKLYVQIMPKKQFVFNDYFRKKLCDSVKLVSLRDSSHEPLIQMADLCAGCFRYILENRIEIPKSSRQLSLIDQEHNKTQCLPDNGKTDLALYFYEKLRKVKEYSKIDLLNPSYQYRFSIFPFKF